MPEAVALPSAVREVQVFRRGALVTRAASLRPGTTGLLALEGLPLCLDDESVRVSLTADEGSSADLPRPTDVRAELTVPPLGALLEPPSQEELQAVERKIGDIRHGAERIDAELHQLDRVALGLPSWDGKEPPRAAPARTFEGVIEWSARLRRQKLEERDALAAALQAAQEELARLRRREVEARARRDARADAVSKRVVLRLRGEPLAGAATLRLEYRVPGAWWVPTYVLRLARDGRSAELGVRAHVAQASGEAWERVRLFLSTADWRRETELPELRSLRIGRRQPEPARRAWRDPPVTGEALLEGLRRAQAALRRSRPGADDGVVESSDELILEDSGTGDVVTIGDVLSDPFAGEGAAAEALCDSDEEYLAAEPAPLDLRARRPEAPQGFGAPPPVQAPASAMAPSPAPVMRSLAAGAPPPAPKAEMFKDAKKKGGRRADDTGAFARLAPGGPGGGGARRPPEAKPEPEPGAVAPDTSFLRFGDLVMPRWDDARGAPGALRRLTWDDLLADLDPAQRRGALQRVQQALGRAGEVERVARPPLTEPVERSSGAFDHRYDSVGLVDVPSDGAPHDVPLLAAAAPVRTTLVVVPRESDQAVRLATLTNPLEAPLLAGPAEVYLHDEFLVTAPLRTVPVGGELTVGLGVEPALKVARNTFFDEESTGLLGGGLALKHRVQVDLASRLPAPVEVEVREVVPVKADKDEAVEVGDESATPAWEKLDKQEGGAALEGGRRWRVTLRPGEEKKLVASYTLRLDAKNEVVGGNRRG